MESTATGIPFFQIINTLLQVDFPCCYQHVLTSLLDQDLHAGVSLVEETHATDQGAHITFGQSTERSRQYSPAVDTMQSWDAWYGCQWQCFMHHTSYFTEHKSVLGSILTSMYWLHSHLHYGSSLTEHLCEWTTCYGTGYSG